MCFSRGKILFDNIGPCKRFDILQLCVSTCFISNVPDDIGINTDDMTTLDLNRHFIIITLIFLSEVYFCFDTKHFLKKELARADSSQLTSTLYDSGRSKPKNMSGTGEGAEWKFWRIPELVERLLLFLDTGSTSRLAKVHPLTMEILQSPLGWRKLLRKSFPCKTIIHSEQDRVEIQHLTQILKNMENPKLRLLELLDVICDQCVPVRRSIIQASCRSPGHISHSVFLLFSA